MRNRKKSKIEIFPCTMVL